MMSFSELSVHLFELRRTLGRCHMRGVDVELSRGLAQARSALGAALKARDWDAASRAALRAEVLEAAALARIELTEEQRHQEWADDLERARVLASEVLTAPGPEVLALATEAKQFLEQPPRTAQGLTVLAGELAEVEALLGDAVSRRALEPDVREAFQRELLLVASHGRPMPPIALGKVLEGEVLARMPALDWKTKALEVSPGVLRTPLALLLCGPMTSCEGVGDITGLPEAVVETAVALLRSNPDAVIEDVLAAARGLEE
jgi:hypothetical protein